VPGLPPESIREEPGSHPKARQMVGAARDLLVIHPDLENQ